MVKKIGKIVVLVLMILNGVFFISNIYVIGNTEAAVAMHDDLAPGTGAVMANTKVLNCFIVGILYVVGAVGIIFKRYKFALAGVAGFVFFDGLYIFQIIVWSHVHPEVWLGFAIFGGLSLLYGVFSFMQWKNGDANRPVPVTAKKGH